MATFFLVAGLGDHGLVGLSAGHDQWDELEVFSCRVIRGESRYTDFPAQSHAIVRSLLSLDDTCP
jgi:hypothetical protein